MADEEYPCRTKTISGITYIVTVYRAADKTKIMSTGCSTEEQADRLIERYLQNPKYTCEKVPRNWEQEICIECGREYY